MVSPRPPGTSTATAPPAAWFGVLGGIAAWLAHLLVSYFAVPWVCDGLGETVLHVITAVTALVALLAVAAAVRVGARAEEGEGTRALARIGMAVSAFFLILIVVEGTPVLLDSSPCAAPSIEGPIILAPENADPFAEGPMPARAAMLLPALVHPGHEAGPDNWWMLWNTDPWLLGGLLLVTGWYLRGLGTLWRRAGRGRGIPRWRARAYLLGILTLLLALASPIDALGESLFSVHMVQHMLLMVVAAPLLVAGRPLLASAWALPGSLRSRVFRPWPRAGRARSLARAAAHPATIFLLHATALWAWHLPSLYQGALESRALHALEHASFLFTAVLFWWALTRAGVRDRWDRYGAGVLYVFATALQSGALGALLVFARTPWYPAHEAGAALWGVDLLVDQQVAGSLMWVPAGLVYAAAMLVLFLGWIRSSERAARRRERAGWARPGWEPATSDPAARTSTRQR